jgi:hypothetical protein
MNSPKITLTRYLYLKDEVEIALLMALLNKSESSLFWAFELYFSGFETDLWNLFWKIYYEFYAALNPTLESFILIKQNAFHALESSEQEEKQKIIATIVNNMLIRKISLDVFMLRQINSQFEIDNSEESYNSILENADYEKIAKYVLEETREQELKHTLEKTIAYFISKNIPLKQAKILKNYEKIQYKNKNIVVLSKILHYFCLLKGCKMGKSRYVYVETDNLEKYDTVYNSKIDSRDILETVCIYGTNESGLLGSFNLRRESLDIKKEYRLNWLYHASFSPLWSERIEKYGGELNHKAQKVLFDDERSDAFYDEFQYDPDEQTREVQEKNIPNILHIKKMKDLCNFHRYGLYKVDESYLDELDKINL